MPPVPTRLQKRWSGRLRTAGALLLLLGAVAVADGLVGLASPQSSLGVFGGGGSEVPLAAGAAALAAGGGLYVLGRRWR